MTVDRALSILDEMVVSALDPSCVAALKRALINLNESAKAA